MCGLVAALDARRVSDEQFALALEHVSHRGLPGRVGFWDEQNVMVGHARLPIVGTNLAFDQPLVSDDCVAAFVGEFHDYREISVSSKCDSELVIPNWLGGGAHAFRLFDGFWSIVIVDFQKNVAALIVDYLAQKPLYYRRDVAVAASDLWALRAFGPMELDYTYLSNVRKWGYDPSGRTPYVGVSKVPPGQAWVFDLDDAEANVAIDYYPLHPHEPPTPEALRELVERSVRRRLVSDVPVATLLSGGLDSAIVALTAARMGAKVEAFHVENDEAVFARAVAEAGRFPLTTLDVEEGSHGAAMLAMQEPVDLGSVLPQFTLAQAIKAQGYNVALSGDGADELFGGYRRAREYDSQRSDVFCELVHYHLPRLDRVNMFHRVELRCPFLAPYVVEAALSVPHAQRTEKELLKRAFSDIVPSLVLNREKKALRSRNPYDQGLRNMVVDDFVKNHG